MRSVLLDRGESGVESSAVDVVTHAVAAARREDHCDQSGARAGAGEFQGAIGCAQHAVWDGDGVALFAAGDWGGYCGAERDCQSDFAARCGG